MCRAAEFKFLSIDELPKNWQPFHFGELTEFQIGKTPPRKEMKYWTDGKFPWVSISDMVPFGVITDTAEQISEDAHNNIFKGRLVPAGHTLMSFKLTIGRIATLGVPAYHNEAIISFKPKGIVDERYLQYYLSQINFKDYQDKAIKGNTLNKGKLARLEIALPPMHEQHKIAALLTAVHRAMETQERLINLASEFKRALMRKLFTKGTRSEPYKKTEIGLVPESWEVMRFGDIAESFKYGTSVKCNYEIGGEPVLRIPNIIGGYIDFKDLKYGKLNRKEVEALRLRHGDLLFVRTNGVKENAGRCSVYRGGFGDNCYYASYLIRARIPHNKLLPDFVDEYSRTATGASFLSGRAIRTADGKFNINTGTLQEMLVPVPDLDEQREIIETAHMLDLKVSNHLMLRHQFHELFRTLLHQLTTAEVRVNDLDLSNLGHDPVSVGTEVNV